MRRQITRKTNCRRSCKGSFRNKSTRLFRDLHAVTLEVVLYIFFLLGLLFALDTSLKHLWPQPANFNSVPSQSLPHPPVKDPRVPQRRQERSRRGPADRGAAHLHRGGT